MLLVNHTEKKVVIKNTQYVCRAGETLRSLDTLRKRWGWSKSAVRRFLNMLQIEGQVETTNETQTTRIFLCNYKKFQKKRTAKEPQEEQEGNATGTDPALNKNEENEKNINDEKKVIPTGASSKSKEAQKQMRVNFNNAVMDRIGSWFYTRQRLWTCYEAIMLKRIAPPLEEIEQLERLYKSDYEYRRKSLSTLLNNWAEELDRSYDYFDREKSTDAEKKYRQWKKNTAQL